MGRLCERPGCSEPAAVAYGMRAPEMVFWLDHLGAAQSDGPGVLCRRHADAIIVPRNWTLDDLRDPDLHLFRPPPARPVEPAARRTRTTSSNGSRVASTDQLALGEPMGLEVAGNEASQVSTLTAESGDEVEHWSPSFDVDDDLDGLLSARGPLLSRAFRGTDRPPRP